MGEKSTYQIFRSRALIQGRDRIDRIENCLVPGMPDTNLCVDGLESWVEIKSPTEPKRLTTPLFGSNHKLSQDQMNWFLRQRNAGGRGWVLIETNWRWMLISGKHADEVNELTVVQLEKMSEWSASKPLRKEHWERLRWVLSRY